jgi:hypothetical protein
MGKDVEAVVLEEQLTKPQLDIEQLQSRLAESRDAELTAEVTELKSNSCAGAVDGVAVKRD